MGRYYRLIIIIFSLISIVRAAPEVWFDSVSASASSAIVAYDGNSLQNSARFIETNSQGRQTSKDVLLLQGIIYWRLQLIAYCQNDAGKINSYGKTAIKFLNQAEQNGADSYWTTSHRALVYQLLTGLGATAAISYGPKITSELNKAKKINPAGYFPLLVNAVNLKQAPSFAGGNTQKAVVEFESLVKNFPDSVDAKIHLADAYIRTGQKDKACAVIKPVLKLFPLNLLARRVADKIKDDDC